MISTARFPLAVWHVTSPRAEVRGATVALTRRTNLRKAMLAPWNELVDDIWWYALAWAQQQTRVAVHQSTLVLNADFARRDHSFRRDVITETAPRDRSEAT